MKWHQIIAYIFMSLRFLFADSREDRRRVSQSTGLKSWTSFSILFISIGKWENGIQSRQEVSFTDNRLVSLIVFRSMYVL